ncbi:hypothetical protein [Mesorhizobium sp. LNJC384A00]|uniref:hypothetical protein n=1 Tax=Mesorhizobium sp. LNJC384A00 TaxID=1287268 RepID=UPI0012EBA4BE|nr:hypothetical protein [Mesorhizobium sp. LNJC384A00]
MSVSAWQIFDAATDEQIGEPVMKSSRAANRYQWYPLIMAIRGVIESCLSGDEATIEVCMANLATAFQFDGRGAAGKYVEDGQTIAEIIKFASEEGVKFSVKHAPVGPRQRHLKKKALGLANAQLARLAAEN